MEDRDVEQGQLSCRMGRRPLLLHQRMSSTMAFERHDTRAGTALPSESMTSVTNLRMGAGFSFCTSVQQGYLFWAVNGIGLAMVIPNGQSIIADSYSEASRGKAFGALYLTGAFGAMAGTLYATNMGAAPHMSTLRDCRCKTTHGVRIVHATGFMAWLLSVYTSASAPCRAVDAVSESLPCT